MKRFNSQTKKVYIKYRKDKNGGFSMFLDYIILSISSSMDSIGIGITYGIKKTKIKIDAMVILWIISFIVTISSVLIGKMLIHVLPIKIVKLFGSVILICIGINTIIKIKSQSFNSYDKDCSNIIDEKEAIALGIAMSLDAFGIGICTNIISNNIIIFPLLVSFLQIIFLNLGNLIGKKIINITKLPSWIWQLIAGIILIIIGLFREIV